MRHLTRLAGALFLLAALGACASAKPPVLPATPLFVPDDREAQLYQTLAHEHEGRVAACAKTHSCERAHFTRALVALYENQQLAARHFQQVVDLAPDGHLAASSLLWLRLLRDGLPHGERGITLARATEQLIQQFLETETAPVQTLQQELKARDKKVEDLTNQIEALKRVDQEMKEKIRPKRQSNRRSSDMEPQH
jgi:hypothetical protein